MAEVEITDLTSLTSVDRAADYLEVADASDSNNSKKATVNSLLDLTSHPVGVDDSQTLTNKVITSPSISSPVLSGTVTGTYTLGGTPTFPATVVTTTGSQTLTNKVLTSPTINTPTITNPTITVDSIGEYTSANGVTIDGLNIKDSKLNTNDSVVTANVTDGAVTSRKQTATTWSGTMLINTLSTTAQTAASFTINASDIPGAGNYKILIIATFEVNFLASSFEAYGQIYDSTSATSLVQCYSSQEGVRYFDTIAVSTIVTIPAATARTFQFRSARTAGSGGGVTARSHYSAVLLGKA